MSKITKYLLYMLVICPLNLLAQTPRETRSIDACKQEVSAIDKQLLHKKTFAWGRLADKDVNITIADINNAADAYLMYFDANGKIRKYVEIVSYPETRGFSIHYFDNEGYLIHCIYYHRSAMDYAFTGVRYMHKNKMLYTDVEMRDEDEKIINAFEGYGEKTDSLLNRDHNPILHTDSILYSYPDRDDLISFKPEECRKIKFTLPKKGEQTIVNVRRANIRKAPSTTAEIQTIALLGDMVQIEEYINNWYKVRINGQTGYINSKLIETVEHKVN